MKILILLSFFSFSVSFAQVSDFKTIDFSKADNIAKLNEGASLNNLPQLVHQLTSKLPNNVEKFRAIYSWVCFNIKADINQHITVRRKRKKFQNDSIGFIAWNTKYKKKVLKKLLKRHKTMCTGYAYLIKELSFLANIECKIIDGYSRTANSNVLNLDITNHSWNAVKINNKWYLCDATWSSGYMDEENNFIRDYNDGYFLTEPILFAKNHYPIHKEWLLNDTLINSEFVATPLVYGETFKHKIITMQPKEMNSIVKKDTEVNFSFKSLKDITNDKVALIWYLGANEKTFKIYDFKNEKGLIKFKYQFKRKGFYDVHLKINDDIVATYTIDVKA